jgi:hypothetical protein
VLLRPPAVVAVDGALLELEPGDLRPAEVPDLLVEEGGVVQGREVLRLGLQVELEVLDGEVESVEAAEAITQVDVDLFECRLQIDRPAVGLDGEVVLLLALIGSAEGEVGVGGVLNQIGDITIVVDGVVKGAFLKEDVGLVLQGTRIFGVVFPGCVGELSRSLLFAGGEKVLEGEEAGV